MSLLDVFFRFPDHPEADNEFVQRVLNLITVPVLVLDRRGRTRGANLQGQELLFGMKSNEGSRRRRSRPRSLAAWLKPLVKSCSKTAMPEFVANREVPGLDGRFCDVVVCPGRVRGRDLGFAVLLPPCWGLECGSASVAERLLASFDAVVAFLDRDLRYRHVNERFLRAFGFSEDDVRGKKLTEVNPSKQAGVLAAQVAHLMAIGEAKYIKAHAVNTVKRGIVFTSVLIWPMVGRDGKCHALSVIMRPSPARTPLPIVEEDAQLLFGKTAVVMGPPMFFTHIDGKILVANASGRELLRTDDGDMPMDIKSAVPWTNPEIIETLYDDLAKGSDYSAVMTDIDTPAGRRLFKVTAYGLKQVGDITSEVLLHILDVTEEEGVKNLLADTTRNLAAEKEILTKIIGQVPLAYGVLDRDLTVLRVNEAVWKAFGVGAEDLIGKKLYKIAPSTRQSGLIGCIKTAIDKDQEIRISDYSYTFSSGRRVLLDIVIYPMVLAGKKACLVVAENKTEISRLDSELRRKTCLLENVVSNVADGYVVFDRSGVIMDVNPVIERITRKTRADLIGKPVRDAMSVEEKDIVLDHLRRATVSRQPLSTGCLKVSRRAPDETMFVDITFLPLLGDDQSLERIVAILHLLTKVKSLEKQVEEYTENLEQMVRKRTGELSSANALLEDTVDKLGSMARSGVALSSLKDGAAVMASFLDHAREILGADFVSAVLVERTGGTEKTKYYSNGARPGRDEIPPDIMEENLAELMLGGRERELVRMPQENLLLVDLVFRDHRGLLLAWKQRGNFIAIDANLARVLCTQLGFSLPVTLRVGELKKERDRSRCLRDIAVRIAGVSSMKEAIGIVAEELSRVVPADRFFWLVSNADTEIWISEVFSRSGEVRRSAKRVSAADSNAIRQILEAGRSPHLLLCQGFPERGLEMLGPDEDRRDRKPCPLVTEPQRERLAGDVRMLMGRAGFPANDGGSLAIAPVILSPNSWGMMCAYSDSWEAFSPDENCFICIAAGTVGYMWQTADAASNIRRLEVTGEAVSELAHDLKYPLSRLRESLSRLACCEKSRLEADTDLKTVREEAEKLGLLTQEMIDISNPKTRKPELMDIARIIDYCVALIETDLIRKGIRLTKIVGLAIPPIFASKKDIKRIILSVLANCIDAVGENGSIEIKVMTDKCGRGVEYAKVVFSDSGPGVAEADMEKIFDPFYSTKDAGSGLGLFSARKRARTNGGDVVCELGEDGNSGFSVWVPLISG